MELPDQPPEMSPEELADIEDEATVEEVQRLIGTEALMRPEEGENMEEVPLLTAKLVIDWRWREEHWKRRARLVSSGTRLCMVRPKKEQMFSHQQEGIIC